MFLRSHHVTQEDPNHPQLRLVYVSVDVCVPRLILCSYFLKALSDGVEDEIILLDGFCLFA